LRQQLDTARLITGYWNKRLRSGDEDSRAVSAHVTAAAAPIAFARMVTLHIRVTPCAMFLVLAGVVAAMDISGTKYLMLSMIVMALDRIHVPGTT
jgi:hypothetical protein